MKKKQEQVALSLSIITSIMSTTLFLMISYVDKELKYNTYTNTVTNTSDTLERYNTTSETSPLTVVSMPSQMEITLKKEDLLTEFNNLEYIDTVSNNYNTNIAISSVVSDKYNTVCNYSIYITDINNTVTNEYIKDDGTLGILDNQMLLRLENTTSNEVFYLDLVDTNSNVINKTITHSTSSDTKASEDRWVMSLVFRNYKDYNQKNNCGKKIKAKVNVTFNECEIVKK